MNKTYNVSEIANLLGEKEHTIYNWIRYAVPEDLKPKKAFNKELGREAYLYTNKELALLNKVKDFKKRGLKYQEISQRLLMIEKVKESESRMEEAFERLEPEPLGRIEVSEMKESRIVTPTMIIASVILVINILILYKLM